MGERLTDELRTALAVEIDCPALDSQGVPDPWLTADAILDLPTIRRALTLLMRVPDLISALDALDDDYGLQDWRETKRRIAIIIADLRREEPTARLREAGGQ